MVLETVYKHPVRKFWYLVIFVLLLVLVAFFVTTINNYPNTALEAKQVQTVKGGYTNPFPKKGETTQVTFVISFGTTAEGKCRFDLFPNSTVPKMFHEFDETCRHVVAHDIFNWLKENLPDSHKWMADKMLQDPKMIRLVNSLIRKS